MDRISIHKLRIYARHGVFQEEKEKGQDFFVSAELYLNLRNAGCRDTLSETVNYDTAAHVIADTFTREAEDTIEAAAENTARELLLHFPTLDRVKVTVEKPDAPVQLDFETISVTVERGWHRAFLGIGSNLGDRRGFLEMAVKELRQDPSVEVLKTSTFIETVPYGPVDQPDFLNGVLEIRTLLTPEELLALCNRIEQKAGRERLIHWGPRTLDMDILLYDDSVISESGPDLRIPHPEMARRKFVLQPLAEIAPNVMHPILHQTAAEMLEALSAPGQAVDTGLYDGSYREVPSLIPADSTEKFTCIYAGVPGAYAEEAAFRYFGKQVEYRNVKSFHDVVAEVAAGKAQFGVVPIENSSAGFVAGNYDIIRQNGVNIVGEIVIEISHCLLGLENARIADIHKVYSHAQGLMQCREFIERHGLTAESVSNTALAAKKVKNDGDIHAAAIASERAAEIYGLKILKRHINFSSDNATRFVVVTRNRIFLRDASRVSICFTAAHRVGALYDIMGRLYENRINMTSIESRPSLKHKWEYIFFVDFEGKLTDTNVRRALGEIQADTDEMNVLGTY